MNKRAKIILIFLILLTICAFYLDYENNTLKITNYEISNNKIPSSFNNYKIIQISDFHNTKSKKLTNDLIKAIKKENPDIIVITGDFIDSRKTDVSTAIKFIEKIKNISLIYYVPGNHESRISAYYDELLTKLKENDVTILDNKVEIITNNNDEINLIGVLDPSFKNINITDEKFMDNVLSELNYNNENYTILLSHRPELFETYIKNEVDLSLTGHTHGGQIRLPIIGGIVAPNQGLFPKYTSGQFNSNNKEMIVSRGIGNSIIPFRINNRPELVVINLKNKI